MVLVTIWGIFRFSLSLDLKKKSTWRRSQAFTFSYKCIDLNLIDPFLHGIVLLTQGGEAKPKVTSIQSSSGWRSWYKINIVLSQGYHDTASSYQIDHRHGVPASCTTHTTHEDEFFCVPFRSKITKPQHQRIQCNIREWNWIVLNSYLEVFIQSLHRLDALVSIVQNIHNICHGKCPSMGGRGRWTKTFLSNREAAFQISRSPKPFTSQSTVPCTAWHLDNFLEHLTAKVS